MNSSNSRKRRRRIPLDTDVALSPVDDEDVPAQADVFPVDASFVPATGNATALPRDPVWTHCDIELHNGPETYEEIAAGCWAEHMYDQAGTLDPSCIERLLANMKEGVVLTSSYSGLGTDIIAAKIIERMVTRLGLATLTECIVSYAVCDNSELCQDILLRLQHTQHPGFQTVPSTGHVFGDITQLADVRDVDYLKSCLVYSRSRVDRIHPESSPERTEFIRLESVKFMHRARQVTAKWRFSRSDKAWCVRHKKYCKRWPKEGQLHVEIAGTTCVGLSRMGNCWMWLDDATIPCLVWAAAIRSIQPTLVVHECVPQFKVEVLAELLGPAFSISSVVFSPVDLGIPTERIRRYSIADCSKASIVHRAYDVEQFSRFAFRRLMVDGNIYFITENTDKVLQQEAERRSMDATTVKHWRDILTASQRQRLDDHEVVKVGCITTSDRLCWMVQLAQNADWCPGRTSVVPTLLRKSLVWRIVWCSEPRSGKTHWHTELDRPLLPLEHMAAEGIPVLSLMKAVAEEGEINPIDQCLQGQQWSDADLRSLAGNMFHVGAVGSVLLFRLMTIASI